MKLYGIKSACEVTKHETNTGSRLFKVVIVGWWLVFWVQSTTRNYIRLKRTLVYLSVTLKEGIDSVQDT